MLWKSNCKVDDLKASQQISNSQGKYCLIQGNDHEGEAGRRNQSSFQNNRRGDPKKHWKPEEASGRVVQAIWKGLNQQCRYSV